MADGCVFCAIAQGKAPASIVCENELALAVVDLRQFHPGHTLRVYPQLPVTTERSTLDSYAEVLRSHLD